MHILPQDNSLTLTTFQSGDIDGAWVPEPWATRMVKEGGGKILVDEKDLWPDGKYVTANVIVSTSFLNDHPDVVKQLIEGEMAVDRLHQDQPGQGRSTLAGQAIEAATGKPIAPDLVDRVVQEPDLHGRPDPVVAGEGRQGRLRRRASSTRPTSRGSTT